MNEDVWICERTAGAVTHSMSDRASYQARMSMVPAPHYEAMQFSVETEMHVRPFGVHQFWFHLQPNYEMRVSVYV